MAAPFVVIALLLLNRHLLIQIESRVMPNSFFSKKTVLFKTLIDSSLYSRQKA